MLSPSALAAVESNLQSRGAELMAQARASYRAHAQAASLAGDAPGDEEAFVFANLVSSVLEVVKSNPDAKRAHCSGGEAMAAKNRRTD
eukprot:12909404-Alexandrium_andersonii.AAC.1